MYLTSVIGDTRSPPRIFISKILNNRTNLSVGIISIAPNDFNLADSEHKSCKTIRFKRKSSWIIPSSADKSKK